jgi:hypothetical protein
VNAGAGAAPQSKTLTLTNTGGQSIDPQAPALTGTDQADYVIDSVNCAATLAPGGVCTYVVRFAPVTADLTYDSSAQLRISYAHGSMAAATATSILSGQVNAASAPKPIKAVSASGTTIVWCQGAGCQPPATRLRFALTSATTVRLVLRTRVHGQFKQVATSTFPGHPGVNRVRIAGRWHGHLAAAAGPVQILVQTHQDGHWRTATTVPLTVRHTRQSG